MGSVATILPWGKAYCTFDVKWTFMAGVALFEIGSAICGAAPHMNAMIVGRVVAGVGGSGEYLGALNYITILTTPREAPLYTGLIIVFWGVGSVLGPVVGGAFARSSATWRWSFYINLVLAALLAPLFFLWFPCINSQPDTTLFSKLVAVDWLGILLNVAVFSLFLSVLALAGGELPCDSPPIIALWIISGAAALIFAFQQRFSKLTTTDKRVFPLHLLANRAVILAGLGTGASATTAFVAIYYIPLFFQFTRGDTAIDAAVRLLPFIIPDVIVILATSATFPCFGFYAPLYLISGVLVVLGGGLFVGLLTVSASSGMIYGLEVVLGLGAGLTSQMAYTVCPLKVEPQDIPAVLGLMNIAQVGTAAVCLAISGAIWNNVGFQKLRAVLPASEYTAMDVRDTLAGTRSSVPVARNTRDSDLRDQRYRLDHFEPVHLSYWCGSIVYPLCYSDEMGEVAAEELISRLE